MNRQKQARMATIVVLLSVLGFVVLRKTRVPARSAPANGSTPQEAIYAMLEAAREGNVGRYVSAYSGQLQSALRQSAAESNDFGKYLKESNAAIKGIAIADPEQLTDREVKARVEYIFQDRNEVQFMVLDKIAGGWKIVRVDSSERVQTLVPYGTPVR